MAAPTTPILDAFNTGATQNLTARAGWAATTLWSGDTSLRTDAVPTRAQGASFPTFNSNYFNTSYANGNCEVYVDMATANTDGGIGLYMCLNSPGAAPNAYTLTISDTGAWRLNVLVAGTPTVLSTGPTQVLSAGDGIWFKRTGSMLEAYYRAGAGAWVLLDSIADSSLATNGFLGLNATNFSGLVGFDFFGGGEPPVVQTRRIAGWIVRS